MEKMTFRVSAFLFVILLILSACATSSSPRRLAPEQPQSESEQLSAEQLQIEQERVLKLARESEEKLAELSGLLGYCETLVKKYDGEYDEARQQILSVEDEIERMIERRGELDDEIEKTGGSSAKKLKKSVVEISSVIEAAIVKVAEMKALQQEREKSIAELRRVCARTKTTLAEHGASDL